MPLVLVRPRAEISLILPDIGALLAARAGTGQRSRTFGTKVLRTWMHVGPLAPHLSLLHSGKVGKMPVIRFFSHLHTRVMQGRAQGASHGRHVYPVGSRIHSPANPYCGAHAAGADLNDLLPNSFVPSGCARSMDRSTTCVGAKQVRRADKLFPRLDPVFRDATAGDVLRTDQRVRHRSAAAHHLQPDRRPDHQQSGGGGVAGDVDADGIWGTADEC